MTLLGERGVCAKPGRTGKAPGGGRREGEDLGVQAFPVSLEMDTQRGPRGVSRAWASGLSEDISVHLSPAGVTAFRIRCPNSFGCPFPPLQEEPRG